MKNIYKFNLVFLFSLIVVEGSAFLTPTSWAEDGHIVNGTCELHNAEPAPACETECPCGGHQTVDVQSVFDTSCPVVGATSTPDLKVLDDTDKDIENMLENLVNTSAAILAQSNAPQNSNPGSGTPQGPAETPPPKRSRTSDGKVTNENAALAGAIEKNPFGSSTAAGSGATGGASPVQSAASGGTATDSNKQSSGFGFGDFGGKQSASELAALDKNAIQGKDLKKPSIVFGEAGSGSSGAARGSQDNNAVDVNGGGVGLSDESYLKQNAQVSLFGIVTNRYKNWEKNGD